MTSGQLIMSIPIVLSTIFVSGIAGGIGGAFLNEEFITRKKDKDGNLLVQDGKNVVVLDWWVLCKRLILGVLAAFVVPLFLVLAAPGQQGGIIKSLVTQACPDPALAQSLDAATKAITEDASTEKVAAIRLLETLSSKLKSDIEGRCTSSNVWWSNLLVLVGFCIVTALVAQRFLQSVAEKLLEKAKEDADEARQTAALAKEESRAAMEATRNMGPGQQLDEKAVAVLTAFAEVPNLPASAADIVQQTGFDAAVVSDLLEDLQEGGLITAAAVADTWRLRGWGMMRVREEVGLSAEDIRILGGIKDLPERRPKAKDLARSLDLPRPNTDRSLERLKRLGLIAKSKSAEDGWRVRSWGKFALEEARNK